MLKELEIWLVVLEWEQITKRTAEHKFQFVNFIAWKCEWGNKSVEYQKFYFAVELPNIQPITELPALQIYWHSFKTIIALRTEMNLSTIQ